MVVIAAAITVTLVDGGWRSLAMLFYGGLMLLVVFAALVSVAGHFLTRYALSDDYVEVQQGILRRSHQRLSLDQIKEATVRQGKVQQLLGTGDIHLGPAGDSQSIRLANIPECHSYSKALLAPARSAI